jgi:hypothetical protein
MGYAGQCVEMFLTGYADMIAAGADLAYDYLEGDFVQSQGISVVFGLCGAAKHL